MRHNDSLKLYKRRFRKVSQLFSRERNGGEAVQLAGSEGRIIEQAGYLWWSKHEMKVQEDTWTKEPGQIFVLIYRHRAIYSASPSYIRSQRKTVVFVFGQPWLIYRRYAPLSRVGRESPRQTFQLHKKTESNVINKRQDGSKLIQKFFK